MGSNGILSNIALTPPDILRQNPAEGTVSVWEFSHVLPQDLLIV